MSPPPPSGPEEPRALSERERAILADIEQDLDRSSPALARAMSRPMTSSIATSAGLVHGGFFLIGVFLVLAVSGMIPAALWAVIAVLGAMVLVPWGMLRLFEHFDRDPD
jgi:VIT1/CCC1 family predicted Fe2+/Mn2+ transporter